MSIYPNETHRAYSILLEYVQTKEGRIAESILETALFIEDTFHLKLSDDEISPKLLGSSKLIITFVKEKLACAESAE